MKVSILVTALLGASSILAAPVYDDKSLAARAQIDRDNIPVIVARDDYGHEGKEKGGNGNYGGYKGKGKNGKGKGGKGKGGKWKEGKEKEGKGKV